MRLSLAMIVKDEARDLPECLASVRGLVDEMVVVDTGSSDGTPELAESLGARVVARAWTGDFSEARNATLEACRGAWILTLDADERLEKAHRSKVRAALEREDVQGYWLEVHTYLRTGAHFGHGGALLRNDGTFAAGREHPFLMVSRHLRLFRAQGEPVYQGKVHELPDRYFKDKGLQVEGLPVVIHHFGKVDARRDLGKQAAYLALALEDRDHRPLEVEAHWNVLQEALLLKDWRTAREAGETILRLGGTVPGFVHLGLSRACLELGDPEAALTQVSGPGWEGPLEGPALTLRGEALAMLGHAREAESAFSRAMEASPAYTMSFIRAAEWLSKWGRPELATAVLEAGLDQNPLDLLLWETFVATRTPDDAPRAAWQALQSVPDGGAGLWHLLVFHGLKALGDVEGMDHVVRLGLLAFPGHPELEALAARTETDPGQSRFP